MSCNRFLFFRDKIDDMVEKKMSLLSGKGGLLSCKIRKVSALKGKS